MKFKRIFGLNFLRVSFILVFFSLLVIGFTLFSERLFKSYEVVLLTSGKIELCLSCHKEIIQEKAHAREVVGCSSCHLGNPLTLDFKKAHEGIIKNPADLRVIEKTCGQANCHPSDVPKVKKSLMATNYGIIHRLLKVFSEEEVTKKYPHLTVESLYHLERDSQIKKSLALDYYRKLCGTCHLWVEKGKLPDFLKERGGGCSSCHLVKKEEFKEKKLHPLITKAIPLRNCVECHNRSGRIGFTYQGLYENEQGGIGEQIWKDGRLLSKIPPDIHFEKGLVCVDCHTREETMGDGNFYKNISEALEISCETCHLHRLITSKGRKLRNIKITEKGVFLEGKISQKLHPLKKPSPKCKDKFHERLSCSACHAPFVPQCYGCHIRYDPRETHLDKIWLKETKGLWEEHESYRRIDHPVLGIMKNKVVIITPG